MANEHDFDEESKLIDDDRESDEESNSLADDDKRQISIIHTKNDCISFTKGYWDYITTEGKDQKTSKHIMQCKNVLCVLVAICGCGLVVYTAKFILDDYFHVFECMRSVKTERFNESNGDYCVEDSDGKIIKCIEHDDEFLKYLVTIVCLLITIVIVPVGCVIIGLICGISFGFIQDVIYSIPISLEKYKQYRKDVEKDVQRDQIELV